MRLLKLLLFAAIMLAFGGLSYGQSYVNFGMKVPYAPNYYASTNIGLKVADSVWFPLYAVSDSNWVAGFDAQGKLKLRYRPFATSPDTSIFATRGWVGANFVPLSDPRIPNWETAYNNSIVSAAFSGTSVKTQTLTQQDGGTITSSFFDRVGTPGFGLRDTFAVDTLIMQTRYRADSMNATKWTVGGNTLAGNGSIGLINSGTLNFITNNTTRASIGSTGQMIIGSASNTIQSVAQMRNDQTTGMFDFIIGRPGGIGANIMVLNFGLFGAANTGTIGYSGTQMNFNTNSILLNTIATTASPSIIGGGLTTGFILNMKPRASIGGGGYNPTSGEAGILDWAIDGSNVWTPASGNANWIGIRPRIVVTAMAPYTGTVRLFDGSCTINSIGAGTLQVYYSSNNVGFSNFHSGTGQNYFQGVITQGTQVNPLSGDGYHSPNPLRASVIKSTTPNTGTINNRAVVWDGATQEFRTISSDTTVVSNAATLSVTQRGWWVFSGTTSTWTFPAVAGNTGTTIVIKNRGTGMLTINSNSGGNDFYETSATNTLAIPAGGAYVFRNDGTYWLIKN